MKGNSKRVKMHYFFLKIFARTSRPKSIKLGTNYLWVKGIQVCSIKKGQVLFNLQSHLGDSPSKKLIASFTLEV
jgi:hypothetical protein